MDLIKIIKYLNKKFDPARASNWDQVGLQRYTKKEIDLNIDISGVLVCLDLTMSSIKEAVKSNANLIITRHPFIFTELEVEKQNVSKAQIIKILKKHKIIVYSIHTNYDSSVSQNIGYLLEEKMLIKKINKFGLDKESFKIDLKKDINLYELISKLQEIFPTKIIIRINSSNTRQIINNFYLTTGSGGSTMIDNKLTNVCFITGEVKWHEWIYANDNDITMIEVGHYMENYFTNDIKDKLNNNFKDLPISTYDIGNQFKEWG